MQSVSTVEAQLRAVLDSVSDCYYALDRDWKFVEFNRASEEYFSLKRGDVLGRCLWDLFPAGKGRPYEDLCRTAMDRGQHGRMEAPSAFRKGNTVEMRVAPMDGGISVALTDITERRRAEAELRKQAEALTELNHTLEQRVAAAIAEREAAMGQLHEVQKTEALGQMAGGVAHDFNNLLLPILGGLELVRRRGGVDNRSERLIDGAIQAAERARTLVQRMLAFARRQPLQPRPVDVPALVTGLKDLLATSVGSRVRLVTDSAHGVPPAFADANQLELALINIALNARDAMPDGGVLTITVAPFFGAPSGVAAGDYVCIAAADTGEGMDGATLKRAVEPFFSTKGVGKGTGLGLSMAHGLAAQLGGALELASVPGVGTTVTLYLPVAKTEAKPLPMYAAPSAELSAGIVLLVDDEDIVRASTKAMLEDLGYVVIEACSAQEALKIIDGGRSFEWLITDHLMPGMTGADLARAVRQRSGEVRVLVVSGYADVEDIAPDLPRLSKPFGVDDLAQRLAAIT